MNIILLDRDQLRADGTLTLTDSRQVRHIHNVHKAVCGDWLKVGVTNGPMGRAEIISATETSIELRCELTDAPPAPAAIQLLLGLPRPKMLKRILQSATSLGVKDIFLINSYRVEKSYWQTPFLEEAALREQLVLGLEQGCDTQMPQVHLIKRFKPFVEDQLPALAAGRTKLVAHPYTASECPRAPSGPITLAIGPEGGFIEYEVELLRHAGFNPVTLGPRILKVETAVPFLISRLT